MQPCKLIQRQLGFAVGQGKTDDDVVAAELAPETVRRPFLRLRSAQAIDPDEVPLGHEASKAAGLGGRHVVAGTGDHVPLDCMRLISPSNLNGSGCLPLTPRPLIR